MDKLIKATNFVHDDHSQFQEFKNSDVWSSKYDANMTANDIVDAVEAIVQQLCQANIPKLKSAGWDQAKYTFKEINSKVREQIRDKEDLASQFQDAYHSLFIQFLEFGPGTIHMHIIKECLQNNYLNLKEYLVSMEEEKIQRLLTAATKGPRQKESADPVEFYKAYDSFISKLFSELFQGKLLDEHTGIFLEFHFHLLFDFCDLDESAYKVLEKVANSVYRSSDKPWESLTDVSLIKFYLQRCMTLIENPNFPPNASVMSAARDYICSVICSNLGKRGMVNLHCQVFDLLLSVSKSCYSDREAVLRLFGDIVDYFRRLKNDHVAKKPALFQEAAIKYTEVVQQVDMPFLAKTIFAPYVMDDLLEKAYANNKDLNAQWCGLMVPLLNRPCLKTVKACRTVAYRNKGVKWKEYPDIARQVFNALSSIEYVEEETPKETKDFMSSIKDITKEITRGFKNSRMLKEYSDAMLLFAMKAIETKDKVMFELGEDLAETAELDVKESKKTIMEVMDRVHKVVKNEEFPWNQCWPMRRALEDLIDCVTKNVKDPKTYTDEELEKFISIARTCQDYDSLDPETNQFASDHYFIFLAIMNKVSPWLKSLNKFHLAADLVPGIMKNYEEDDEHMIMLSGRFITDFSQASSGQPIVGPLLGDLIKIFLDQPSEYITRCIDAVYPSNPKALKPYYRQIMTLLLENGDTSLVTALCQLFYNVSKKQPELFTAEDTKCLLQMAREDSSNQSFLLQIIQDVCKRCPDVMVKHVDLLMDHTGLNPVMLSWVNNMICSLALYEESIAPKCIDHLLTKTKTYQDTSYVITALHAVQLIGFKYLDLLKPRRNQVASLQIVDPNAEIMKQNILDMIDGKTPEDLVKQLQTQQQDITDLVGRVEDNEEVVTEIKEQVIKQEEQLETVQNDVTEQGQRLNKVENTVDDTVAKVEEIDQKTLSHAPYWSRDVSKLLVPMSEQDWRLLSSRLGYSNDDIRGWAQQADPCMAMLNEWYATHKTSEATFAILTQLQEMDRLDAAIIVENAMKNAEAVVEDEDFEYASPPQIFISYQWAHQEEAKLLKRHLEMAGYESWLDIGQMGGGDKLFGKIDSGIRAAKVVISCVTANYAKSPNCNREVNLSVGLNKSMIPLLMEKCTWPPPGSMGPIFSEYLFIRFYQRSGEEVEDDRFWPRAKFQELLMQLNMFGLVPDEGKVDSVYRNWWMPVVEEIKIDKSKTKDGGKAIHTEQANAEQKVDSSPDVFISYQWGKQKSIIHLYESLTSLGFSCWLDIKQMGGGDSLYDKIDRGVRGCRVVLSCVSVKYALSANCRREVSLADALKKPLLPLLMENMSWPPSGPMSLVMTQLLYIDFSKTEDVQMKWDGPKFHELLNKIKEHIPRALEEKPTEETKCVPKSSETPGIKEIEQTSATSLIAKTKDSGATSQQSKGREIKPPPSQQSSTAYNSRSGISKSKPENVKRTTATLQSPKKVSSEEKNKTGQDPPSPSESSKSQCESTKEEASPPEHNASSDPPSMTPTQSSKSQKSSKSCAIL